MKVLAAKLINLRARSNRFDIFIQYKFYFFSIGIQFIVF